MNKDYIIYGIIGIVAGLLLGFLVANWTGAGVGAVQQAAGDGAPASASVNSSSQNEQLPPGHPPIDGATPTEAPPLPPGTEPSSRPAGATPPAGESLELPSLEPLPAGTKAERAEQKYKNIQMFKGLPADRIESIMFSFKAALGVECTHCHVKDHFDKDDKAAKQIARKMIQRTRAVNKDGAGGGRVTCYTCHRGQLRPPS